jgi:hypothetical protein
MFIAGVQVVIAYLDEKTQRAPVLFPYEGLTWTTTAAHLVRWILDVVRSSISPAYVDVSLIRRAVDPLKPNEGELHATDAIPWELTKTLEQIIIDGVEPSAEYPPLPLLPVKGGKVLIVKVAAPQEGARNEWTASFKAVTLERTLVADNEYWKLVFPKGGQWPIAGSQFVLLRPIIVRYIKENLSFLWDPEPSRQVVRLLVGTPGIGKTHFAVALTWYLGIYHGKDVVFMHHHTRVGDVVRGIVVRKGHVEVYSDNLTWHLHAVQRNDIIILDTMAPAPDWKGMCSHMLGVSSPNCHDNIHSMLKLTRTVHCFPCWELPELQLLFTEDTSNAIPPAYVASIFDYMGGVPRAVMRIFNDAMELFDNIRDKSDRLALSDLMEQVAQDELMLVVGSVPRDFNPVTYAQPIMLHEGTDTRFHCIINYIPDPHSYRQGRVCIVSSIAERLLSHRLAHTYLLQLYNDVVHAQHNESMRGRGDTSFVTLCDRFLKLASEARVPLTTIMRSLNTGEETTFTFEPASECKTFAYMDDITSEESPEEYYWLSRYGCFPALDGILKGLRCYNMNCGNNTTHRYTGGNAGIEYVHSKLAPGTKEFALLLLMPEWAYALSSGSGCGPIPASKAGALDTLTEGESTRQYFTDGAGAQVELKQYAVKVTNEMLRLGLTGAPTYAYRYGERRLGLAGAPTYAYPYGEREAKRARRTDEP